MPRRSILSTLERDSLLSLPEGNEEMIRRYTLSDADLAIINQHRGAANRLGFAVQLCYMRYPGIRLGMNELPSASLLSLVAAQLKVSPSSWNEYGIRSETRREHLLELQEVFGFQSFTMEYYRPTVNDLLGLAMQTDKGLVLAEALAERLRQQNILLPEISVIERICAEAITHAIRHIHKSLTESLSDVHRQKLDDLLRFKDGSKITQLIWLKQSPTRPNSRHMLEHIERLKVLQAISLPANIGQKVHQNRLLKIAREGTQMTSADLARFEPQRRYATLVALVTESTATIIDEIIDLHDRILGRIFNIAKNRHQKQFQESGKDINNKVLLYSRIGQVLLEAKQNGSDPFAAIESVIPWDAFAFSVNEAQTLAQHEDFDFLHQVGESYATMRRYAPEFLDVLKFRAPPAGEDILEAIEMLRFMNSKNIRKVPDNAPTKFIKSRWSKLIRTDNGIDKRYYELCALSELKNALRSGDIWVQGSRQFKDFEEYLLPLESFAALKLTNNLPLPVETDCDQYLNNRLTQLEQQLEVANSMAASNDLPEAIITTSGLKITPLDAVIPDAAQALIDQASALLPHVKITDLLLEVDSWTGFSKHFTNMKTGEEPQNKILLLTAILADGINLGLTKMAKSCPGTTYSKLSWLQAWHIRDETYSKALAEIVNSQLQQPFAENWGDGTTSSSDGQRFRAGGKAQSTGHVNPKYGTDPGRTFYTHISDQYAPFSSKVINVGILDSTYVLDGLLYHESDLRIEEHYTDTAGFTDHVFAMMHLLGFRFAPRIHDLGDTKLYIPKSDKIYGALKPMIGSGNLNINHIRNHWDEILRLATSIKQVN